YENGVFNRRYGGDLQGVMDRLDYLKDLGINALYFNPVFYARSLHKYDGAAMHHMDPYFGPDPSGDLKLMATESSDPQSWHWTAADKLFLKLVHEAHSRGIRVIIDGVFNHAGQSFFAFEHLRKHQQKSPYRDWYTVTAWDDPETTANEFRYASWWGVETLPEFANTKDGDDLHAGPTAYLHDITKRWLDPNGDGKGGDGIDGWRLDVANEVPDKFWRTWHRLVRAIHPQAYTVAEIWDDSAAYLQRCGFSASMNYHAFAFPSKGYLLDGQLPAAEFRNLIQERLDTFSTRRQRAMLNLYDSHDTERLASMIVNGGRRPYVQPQRFDFDIAERGSARHDADYDITGPTDRHKQ
ncbi:MAG TPA: alpha-amylase family glycosyl hydrolase, partial [Pirellulaceae bacterium]